MSRTGIHLSERSIDIVGEESNIMVLIVPEETERLEEPHRRSNELTYRQMDGRTDRQTDRRHF